VLARVIAVLPGSMSRCEEHAVSTATAAARAVSLAAYLLTGHVAIALGL